MDGRLQNRMLENMKNTPEPFVGMDVTMCMWSDRHSTKIEEIRWSLERKPKEILLENGYTITLRTVSYTHLTLPTSDLV